MRNWTPTHEIRRPGQPTVRVMLDEGRGYTEEEWRDEAPADYERDDDGKWLFQGQPFAGQVIDQWETKGVTEMREVIRYTRPGGGSSF